MCKRFNECVKHPIFWEKVDVKFSLNSKTQNEVAMCFLDKFRSSVSYVKLHFELYAWKGGLNFEELCQKLTAKCFHLHTLILHHAIFSVHFYSVISFCCEFFPNLKVLMLPKCHFGFDSTKKLFAGFSSIEVLDVSYCNIKQYSTCLFRLVMPNLKRLNLSGVRVSDWMSECACFLHPLEFLQLGRTNIPFPFLNVLRQNCANLTELCLRYTDITDRDLEFLELPLLKTVCLKDCKAVTSEGIVSLVQSCRSLENIYVDRDVAESYAEDPFVIANASQLGIVIVISDCDHHNKLSFS